MKTRLGRWVGIVVLMGTAVGSSLYAGGLGGQSADEQDIKVKHQMRKAVQAIWDGGDVSPTGHGDGEIELEQGVPKTAVLKVQCNAAAGYTVRFGSPNATGATTAKMVLGGGGTPDTELDYSLALDVSQLSGTSTVTKETLDIQSVTTSLELNFQGTGDIRPMDDAAAHQVKLVMTMDPFDAYYKQEGLYEDTVTAWVTIR